MTISKKPIVHWPLYAKFSIICVGFLAFFYIMVLGKDLIFPVLLSLIIAILLNPIVNQLCRWRFNRILAIIICVVGAIAVIIGLSLLLGTQVAELNSHFPEFKKNFLLMNKNLIHWASVHLNLSEVKVNAWWESLKTDGMGKSNSYMGTALQSLSGVLILIMLLPVYIFLLLFYKPMLLEFIAKVFKNGQKKEVAAVLNDSKSLIQSYLIGLIIEAALVAILNSTGLMIIGVQFAILIGVLGALLNFIPYIGGIVAIALPTVMSIAVNRTEDILWIFPLYGLVQFIDNNILVPKIVATRVKINALVSIFVVLFGGALWGIAGMFLAIPIIAIVKVICDHMESTQAIGFLLGDNQAAIGVKAIKLKK